MTESENEKWLGPEQNPVAGGQPVQQKGADDGAWAQGVLEKLATAALHEQRRSRRWGIFFKILTFSYLIGLLALFYFPTDWGDGTLSADDEHTALVKLHGIIADDSEANARAVNEGLGEAFKDKKTKGVILQINSPGGSPVQSRQVYDEIRRLREEYPDTPLYAVITDLCASGGYYVAAAADKIYGDRSSIVGSIGVIMPSFGFVDALEKVGVERRLITAGEHKALMDPFSPLKDDELVHVRSLLDSIHQQFIDAVKEGRGERLKTADDNLFSGLVWTGEQAREYGLIDDFGSAGYVAREVIGAEKLVDFTAKRDLIDRLAKRVGAATAQTLERIYGLSSTSLR